MTLPPRAGNVDAAPTRRTRRTTKPTAPDTRRRIRVMAALILPIGPACIAVVRFLLPYSTVDSGRETIDAIAAHPDRQSICVWLGTIAVFALVPSVIWIGRLTRRGAPRLTAVAVGLLVPGYVGLAILVSLDAMAWYGVTHGVDRSVLTTLFENGHPTVSVNVGVFVLGHVVGTILLGIAMWRSRAVPSWAALLTVLSQPLHFTAAVIVASPSLDLVGWGFNAIGFAAASVAILRLPDDEWDLPPAGVASAVTHQP